MGTNGRYQRALDGFSKVPGRQVIVRRNWEELRRLFFSDSEYMNVRTWLHEQMRWTPKEITNGYTIKKISGWSSDKAKLEQQKTEAAIEQMLVEQRKRIPNLLAAKLNLVAKIIASVSNWNALPPPEKKLCYEILKTELGEPTNIKVLGIGTAKDPVEELLERYNLMSEGRIIIDAEPAGSTEHSSQAETASSGSSLAAPQS